MGGIYSFVESSKRDAPNAGINTIGFLSSNCGESVTNYAVCSGCF